MDGPLVSVVIVVRNGARDVIGALQSIEAQDYSPLEVIVVDGMSEDGTRQLVERYSREQAGVPIRLLDNLQRIQATGWNVGIRAAGGECVLRLDAVHCRLNSGYIRGCLERLQQLRHSDSSVVAVGGRRVSVAASETGWSRAIAAAQSSRFGVGNASYRLSTKAGFTDTLGVPLYFRSILLQVGLFNDSLGRSEDNEFHARLRQQGFKLFYDPAYTAIYHPRTSLKGLASQMFHNGWWVSATIVRTRSFPFGIRHVIPFGFYLGLCLAAACSVLGVPYALLLLLLMLAAYLLGSIGAAASALPTAQFWRVILVFWVMHASYA
ncbi:MAG TPA: glycosyltransferase, partial [Terriglobales bacterium]|nr:glycosyltransferase [Terriglobales bacterium]